MKNKHAKVKPVPYEVAKKRVLDVLHEIDPMVPSDVADYIWPGHKMRAQGAAFAAGAVLRKMANEKLVRWTLYETDRGFKRWGWVMK